MKRPPKAGAGWVEAPEAAGVEEVAGCEVVCAVVVAGLPRLENKLVEPPDWPAALPKRLVAGFEASAGGAPAGVVEGIENKGLAGVDVPVANALAPPS